MAIHSQDACATSLKVKRRPPRERVPFRNVSDWALSVEYREGEVEHLVKLPLSSDEVAQEVEILLAILQDDNPTQVSAAALDLFVCLHEEWGQTGMAGRHPAWDAVFRFLAPLVATKTTV